MYNYFFFQKKNRKILCHPNATHRVPTPANIYIYNRVKIFINEKK